LPRPAADAKADLALKRFFATNGLYPVDTISRRHRQELSKGMQRVRDYVG